jgi:hypothetical protein
MAGGETAADRLYGCAPWHRPMTPPLVWSGMPPEPQRFLSVAGATLRIAPFLICKWDQRYVSPEALCIDLERLPPALYRIVAVHNFRMEDRNPDLDECLAGIFLARRVDCRWEEAEDHPVECRSIEVLGHLDTVLRRIESP